MVAPRRTHWSRPESQEKDRTRRTLSASKLAKFRMRHPFRPIFSQKPSAATPEIYSELEPAGNQVERLLFALRFHFPIKRCHADTEHARGLFARTAAMVQSGVDISRSEEHTSE